MTTGDDALADVRPQSPEWDALSTFFGAYLNQDFVEDYGGPWQTVQGFARSESLSYVLRTADQVDRLLARPAGDEEVQRAIEGLGMGYRPTAEGWTVRAWLSDLALALRQ